MKKNGFGATSTLLPNNCGSELTFTATFSDKKSPDYIHGFDMFLIRDLLPLVSTFSVGVEL
ncbi:MAG: hypothetical protein ACJAUY_001648 [Cognaticolwellia sp.]|jgi:hypothetical protein|tara:strand:- start:1597 stop:1779 length:183 start_codon:yes stop_codon:yes gene_type:complete